MNNLTLSKQELRELLSVKMRDFFTYLVTLVLLSVLCQVILRSILPEITYMDLMYAGVICIAFFTAYIWRINKQYFSELLRKQKRVYRGMLSDKTILNRSSAQKYSFNMDGYIFYVEEKIFHAYNEGDLLEFHISPSTKHLFKVEKVGYIGCL